jgi:ribonuclease HI
MPRIVENALLIYTDGSLYPRGRKGGYGAIFVHVDAVGEERVIEEYSPPGISGTTVPRMELQACIDALKMAPDFDCFHTVGQVVIRTDSKYVANYYRYALGSWRSCGWKNAQGRPVENADLWKDFVRAHGKIRKRFDIEWIKGHGKGHAKDPHNVRADKLAKESAKNPLSRPVFRSSVRRKKSSEYTKRGSVRILGQRMVIHVIEVLRMRVQKTWQYRYEVASKDSADYRSVDWIYSDLQMRDGHHYEVQVNNNVDHPRVLEVREVDVKELISESGETKHE